jgi:hypothetical membrane protein
VNKTQIIGFTTLILSYLFLVLNFVFDEADGKYVFLFYLAWASGIVSVVSNILLADKIDLNKWIIAIFGICGILWLFPYFLITYFGIPCLIIFLGIGIYLHIKAFSEYQADKKTA